MIATLDERHIARGYDPYNSADQPHVIAALNAKLAGNALPPPLQPCRNPRVNNTEIDAMMRRGFRHLVRHGYEFFPGQR